MSQQATIFDIETGLPVELKAGDIFEALTPTTVKLFARKALEPIDVETLDGQWFALYRAETGELVATGDQVPVDLPPGIDKVACTEFDNNHHGNWNPETLSFEYPPEPEAEIDDVREDEVGTESVNAVEVGKPKKVKSST